MKLIQNGDVFQLANVAGTPEKLMPGNYLLKLSQQGFYLQKKEDFALPAKIYGDHHEIERWLKSYEANTKKNLGIILSGLKGTGKTITCQMLCKKANKPVIIINEPFVGSDFIDFLTSPIFNDCIVFIDEYEKIYQKYQDGKNPHDFLQIMDGNYNTRLLFLLTVNEMSVNDYLINRPGRIKYRKSYDNLASDVLNEIIDDLLVNKEHKQSVFDFFDKLGMTTFDLAVCLIKEMNLFQQDAHQCAKYLNLKCEPVSYDVIEVRDGKSFPCQEINLTYGTEEFWIHREEYFEGTQEKDYDDAEEDAILVNTKTAKFTKTGLDSITIVTPKKHYFKLKRKPKYYYTF